VPLIDPKASGVSAEEWAAATASCHMLRVAKVVDETHDARSLAFEIPEALRAEFAYESGQFVSFKIPLDGRVLVRSYSLCSSPHTDTDFKITVKRVDDGRISNWLNDHVRVGDELAVVPPAGLFVLTDEHRGMVLFAGGSGITPVISIIKTALATTARSISLVYANRDDRSIIFHRELAELSERYPTRFEITHRLDDRDGFLTPEFVRSHLRDDLARDFYMCGPAAFMDVVEQTLHELGVAGRGQIHIERFVSPHDPNVAAPSVEVSTKAAVEGIPETITIVLDGSTHEIPYREGDSVLAAARRAGLDPPFSCEEGYCSCCMAKLADGDVVMKQNDCLTPDLLAEGWVLTCQARCHSRAVRIEYPD
jgi:3-ketosteroid 9alpha-monooxygenase subunit B